MEREWLGFKGIRTVILLLTVLSLLQGAAIVGQALLLAHAVSLWFEGLPGEEAVRSALLFFTAFAARHTIVWLQRHIAGQFAEQTGESVRKQLLHRLLERGPSFAGKEGSGRLVTLALDGMDRFRASLELTIPRMLDMAMVTTAILVSVYWLDMVSGFILTAALPILIGFFILLGLAARAKANKQWQSYRRLAHHFTDSLRGLVTLKFLDQSRAHAKTVERVSDEYRQATMRTLRVAFLSSLALDFFTMLSVASVAVGLGVRLIEGDIGFEAALAVLLLAPEYFLPVRQLGADYHASLDGKEAWRSIRAIIEGEDGREKPGSVSPATGEKKTSAEYAALALTGICVVGADGTRRLDELSVKLDPGIRRIGIVGASGAGKSTLLGVLGGFIEPTAGNISIGNQPITGLLKPEWQRQIAYIPQHPYLFSQSLADNIRLYTPEAGQEQVERAIEAAGLRELTDSLPNGSNERIGEGGRALSGGQAQRVALARALLADRPIVLLDEPTAHLDIETEWELKQTLLASLGSKRLFLATHRLHWMQQMDFILVLHQGRLVETGSHDQLIRQHGVYYRLIMAHEGGENGA
ncbi:thiol reductant ABC exporter subunit CydD [Paenibacillus sp. y28]|uniref:thiol reductant ABC exporter subunit CydD n=1 Tax=Paenibacillus sp. y28 TaxID=3129110 RepID=UPI003016404E